MASFPSDENCLQISFLKYPSAFNPAKHFLSPGIRAFFLLKFFQGTIVNNTSALIRFIQKENKQWSTIYQLTHFDFLFFIKSPSCSWVSLCFHTPKLQYCTMRRILSFFLVIGMVYNSVPRSSPENSGLSKNLSLQNFFQGVIRFFSRLLSDTGPFVAT